MLILMLYYQIHHIKLLRQCINYLIYSFHEIILMKISPLFLKNYFMIYLFEEDIIDLPVRS